jgi:hypothetical protein
LNSYSNPCSNPCSNSCSNSFNSKKNNCKRDYCDNNDNYDTHYNSCLNNYDNTNNDYTNNDYTNNEEDYLDDSVGSFVTEDEYSYSSQNSYQNEEDIKINIMIEKLENVLLELGNSIDVNNLDQNLAKQIKDGFLLLEKLKEKKRKNIFL